MRKLHSLALLFFFLPSPSFATSFLQRPFADAVLDAPAIVRGRILQSHTDWAIGADGVRRIYTFTELALDEVIKGSISERSGEIIVLRELGGEKDGVGLHVSGTATFETGEDVVLLIHTPPVENSVYAIRGMMMGKLTIEEDENGAEFLVGPALGNEKKWSLNALGQLVLQQSRDPLRNRNSPMVESPLPSPRVSISPTHVAASQLHSSHQNETLGVSDGNRHLDWEIVIVLGIVTTLGLFLFLKLKSKS